MLPIKAIDNIFHRSALFLFSFGARMNSLTVKTLVNSRRGRTRVFSENVLNNKLPSLFLACYTLLRSASQPLSLRRSGLID